MTAALLAVLIGLPAFAAAPKPRIVTAAQWGSHRGDMSGVKKQNPEHVTIHHASVFFSSKKDPVTFLVNLQSWGQSPPDPPRKEIWPDLPYHLMIAPDGRIFEGRDLGYEPATNTVYPVHGHIGIELMGDFEKQKPTEAQLKSLVALTAWLLDQYKLPLSEVRGHKDLIEPGAQTSDCPGRELYRYLENGELARRITAARTPRP